LYALSSCDDIFVQTCLDQNFTQKGKGLLSRILFGFNIFYNFLQLRKAQDDIIEIQTAHDHIQKRYEKLKTRRKEET
jgi:hypothetical protein